MFRKIVKFQGKKMLVYGFKDTVIEHFIYASKYYTNTDIQVNKCNWTIKFNNGLYDYTFILPNDFIRDFTMGKY